MYNSRKGFTLIELLVVIAIIGILSAIVLASLNSARDKASDAAVRANLNNIRAQAELFYDNNGQSYDGACANTQIANAEAAANTANGTGSTECADSANAWAVAAQLKTSINWYCVDSTGNSLTTTSATQPITDGSDYAC
jgi:prepilin-type N-terminal cleavage/methylation domain-containing protein